MNETPSPPAFPNEGFNGWGEPQQGMTLRDYFAAKAINVSFRYCTTNESAAEYAYKMADAMMKARNK